MERCEVTRQKLRSAIVASLMPPPNTIRQADELYEAVATAGYMLVPLEPKDRNR